ncbi:alpha beta hydrolase domain containing protein [Sporothrix schenckii 1099-18]|uniref:Alpha/beta hydrolase fold-3 domain-containing protein n=2 Tax=Sporothrix schenckii TaxID=29908 RepID=U7PXN6_SPOS1|nr:alpha beta hydrolase domain containing protein [Sporothrix schenckii 1099-18]ERS99489.1 hypothetical protein HMPREF1624_04689 [Sporothrix schenckii ATCC 58251]KJR82779.1 alpha beta hydrolase domain containing protein [Sporothrix schenckii 1099-18]
MAQPSDEAAAPPDALPTTGPEAPSPPVPPSPAAQPSPPAPRAPPSPPPAPVENLDENLDDLVLADPPPLDPVWLQHERDQNLPNPSPVISPLERQPLYAVECRELTARMTAPGARDSHLADGIRVQPLTVTSSLDGTEIPLLAYSLLQEGDQKLEDQKMEDQQMEDQPEGDQPKGDSKGTTTDTTTDTTAHSDSPDYAVLYIHGGGLHIGEADSEELSCRRILKDARLPAVKQDGAAPKTPKTPTLVVYSVGYRIMPQHPASTCVADCIDAYRHVRAAHPDAAATKLLVVGSSSGGELAAFVAQEAAKASMQVSATTNRATSDIAGVVLRCPVTSDAFNGEDYIPPVLRPLHTSAANPAFATTLLRRMSRRIPRDDLPYMPLEAPTELLAAQPRHWIQVCTNDMLYSDGVCYAKALQMAGAAGVKVDVVVGWPHTFWLKTPWMDRALEADKAMLRGLAWVAGGPYTAEESE